MVASSNATPPSGQEPGRASAATVGASAPASGAAIPAAPSPAFDYITHYGRDAEVFDYETDIAFRPDDDRRKQTVLRLCGARRGDRTLDIGSGSGWLAIALARRGCRANVLDLAPANLTRIRAQDASIRAVLAESATPPFASGVFDWVTAIEVVEHLTDPAAALRQIERILRPGGRTLVCVPYNERIEINLCIHCNRPTPKSAHLHSFTRERLVGLIESAGLIVESHRLFVNKGISLLRGNALLRWLPFPAWRAIDALANALTDKSTYIGIVARKR
jgi:2-polyprenyl-3-methyl-5-hydroxy-6-metoxy-1,4-benzoquinol methylase